MNCTIKDMLGVIKHGRPWTHRVHYSSTDSGPFSVSHEGMKWGQMRLVLYTKGAYVVPHFIIYNPVNEREWLKTHRTLNRGQPGFAVVLRAFAQQIPELQRGLLIDQNTPKGRMPHWQVYLPRRERHASRH